MTETWGMTETPREMAAKAFASGDQVRTPDGRVGTVSSVNEYAAAVVTVRFAGRVGFEPFLFTELEGVYT